MAAEDGKKQLLHLVFGGELKKLGGTEFRDLDALDIVGIYPDYQTAQLRLESQGASQRGQCPYALFHRSSAPAARPRQHKAGQADIDGA